MLKKPLAPMSKDDKAHVINELKKILCMCVDQLFSDLYPNQDAPPIKTLRDKIAIILKAHSEKTDENISARTIHEILVADYGVTTRELTTRASLNRMSHDGLVYGSTGLDGGYRWRRVAPAVRPGKGSKFHADQAKLTHTLETNIKLSPAADQNLPGITKPPPKRKNYVYNMGRGPKRKNPQ